MRSKAFLASIVCGLIAIAVQPKSAAAATPTLAGSWRFTLTPTVPPTPVVPPVIPIPGLVTFTPNGSTIETDGSEFAPSPTTTVAAQTPGHGIWENGPTPGSLYVEYISLVLNPNGSLFGENVTTMLVSLSANGRAFMGSYTTVQEANGVTTTVSGGTVSGTLIPKIPLP